MKTKFQLLLTACLVAIVTICASCSQKTKLQLMVDDAAKQCPLDLGKIGKVSSFSYENGQVVMELCVNEDFLDIEVINKDHNSAKQNSLNFLAEQPEDLKAMMQEMITEKADFVYRYVGDKSHKSAEIRITPEELAKALNSTSAELNYTEELARAIDEANQICPNPIDDATQLDSIYLSADYAVYNYTIFEDKMDFSTIEDADNMKVLLATNIQSQKAAMSFFITCCIKTNHGIEHRYIADRSRRTITVRFSEKELKELIK